MDKCSECGSSEIYVTETNSGGVYGPILLPGTGTFLWQMAKFRLFVCGNCGFVKFFVKPVDIEKVKKSKQFKLKHS